MSKQRKERGISYSHVALAYLSDGRAGLDSIWATGRVSRETVRSAIKHLEERKKDTTEFEAWYDEVIGTGHVSSPTAGETRVYTAQLQKGSPTAFLKIPLPAGVAKGTRFSTYYHDNLKDISINPAVVERVASEAAAE